MIMKTETDASSLSRRDALRQTLLASLGISILPASATETTEPLAEPDFVPEHDYPFFGYEPTNDS